MANSITVSSLTKYVDQLNVPIIRESIFEAKTFQKISIQTGVNYASALNVMTSNLLAQAGGCSTFNPLGGVTLSQSVITVCPIKIEEAICWDIIEQYWLGAVEKIKGSYAEVPPNFFEEAYVNDKIDKISRVMEDIYWRGDTTGSGNLALCDGLLKYLGTAPGVTKVLATTAGALTSSTAIAAVEKTLDALPEAIAEKTNLVMFVSPANFNTIYRAYRNLNNFYIDATAYANFEFVLPGSNVTLVGTAGLSGSFQMVLTNADNLYFGTDDIADPANFKLWYENKDNQIDYRAQWKQGFGVAYNQSVVLYTGATS